MPETRTGSRSRPRPAGRERPAAEEARSDAVVCNVAFCPICLAVTAAQGAAPDAVDHLLAAAPEAGVRRFVAQSFAGTTYARTGGR